MAKKTCENRASERRKILAVIVAMCFCWCNWLLDSGWCFKGKTKRVEGVQFVTQVNGKSQNNIASAIVLRRNLAWFHVSLASPCTNAGQRKKRIICLFSKWRIFFTQFANILLNFPLLSTLSQAQVFVFRVHQRCSPFVLYSCREALEIHSRQAKGLLFSLDKNQSIQHS